MQATKEGKSARIPPAGHNRRKNADPEEERRPVKPVEGAQTGSEGLGYLKDADTAGSKTGKSKHDR
jgi:hypothetical protein